jgi:glycosyltransferase involved in cell wall biosynthesis
VRILLANDGEGDAGGVQSYLAAVIPALAARGHAVALLHLDPLRPGASPAPAETPHFGMAERGMEAAVAEAVAWAPDVAFVHNMRPLEVDGDLIDAGLPVVKMMHGYFGTCVSGLKSHRWPSPVPCSKPLGAGCIPVYAARKCGRMRPGAVVDGWRWANHQNELLDEYAAIVTASRHMRDEFVRNGAPASRVHAIPLFPTLDGRPAPAPAIPRVLFLGRMTAIKGGDLLIRAVALASKTMGAPIRLTMAGDGPQRAAWERLAARLGVAAEFTGWVDDGRRADLLRSATILAVPSVWPEPFGLVGLEAGVFGVPAIAFDVGGIDDWLTDGVNGILVPADPPTAEAFAEELAAALPDAAAMRRGARQAAERLTLERHVDAVERVLADAAASRRPAVPTSAD